jgi:pilus assembly protein CpaF
VSVSTYESLRLRVLELLDDRKVDASDLARVVDECVDAYQRAATGGLSSRLVSPADTKRRLMRSLTEAGPLTPFFEDTELAGEIGVRDDTITATTTDGRQEVVGESTSRDEMEAVTRRLLAAAGVDVNDEHPIVVHQVWGDRVRSSVSIPPVADGLDATFRIYRSNRTTFDELVEWGSLTEPAAQFLRAVQLLPSAGQLYSGPPQAGKTTLASAALRAVPETTNVRIIQSPRELEAPDHPGGRWSPEGGGHTIRTLVQRALQFAPGLLVVGETLGEEAFELIKASNSGCAFLTTMHAKSARLAMESLTTAALMAGENVPERAVRRSFAALIDVVVHCGVQPLCRRRCKRRRPHLYAGRGAVAR